jgi:hypothetical protein
MTARQNWKQDKIRKQQQQKLHNHFDRRRPATQHMTKRQARELGKIAVAVGPGGKLPAFR